MDSSTKTDKDKDILRRATTHILNRPLRNNSARPGFVGASGKRRYGARINVDPHLTGAARDIEGQ